jgi:hypothetical protein
MTFKGVNIENMTDNVYVKITSINGIDTETAMESGYINIIPTQKEILPAKYYILR